MSGEESILALCVLSFTKRAITFSFDSLIRFTCLRPLSLSFSLRLYRPFRRSSVHADFSLVSFIIHHGDSLHPISAINREPDPRTYTRKALDDVACVSRGRAFA